MADSIAPSAKTKKDIVILGGSYGGVSIAHHLLRHAVPNLPEKSSYQVVVVSPSTQVFDRPACPRAMIADSMFDQAKLFVSIPKVFEQYPQDNFRFVHGTATALDHTNRKVTVSLAKEGSETIEFHALVIATGASTRSPLLGYIRDDEYLRESWNAFRKALPNAKNIVICGGGPAGIETAGELGEHLNGRAGWFTSQLANPKVNITVVNADSKILPCLRDSLAQNAEQLLAKVGVTVKKNSRVKSVSPENAGTEDVGTEATVTLEDGSTLEADIYIPATGMRPNTSFIDSALLASDGRVETNSGNFHVDKAGPRIYAVGDVANYARPAVHLILDAIPILGANIKRDLLLEAGKSDSAVPAERTFKEDTSETQMVPIGKSKAVGAAKGYVLPSFLIWLIKGRDYWLWTTPKLWSGQQWAKES